MYYEQIGTINCTSFNLGLYQVHHYCFITFIMRSIYSCKIFESMLCIWLCWGKTDSSLFCFFFFVKFEFLFLNIHDVNECNNPFALQHVIQLRFSFITAAAFRTTNRKLNEINSKQTVTVCDTHKNSKASWSVYLSNYNDIWSRMKRTTNYNIRDSPIFNDNNNRIICVPDDRAGDRRCMYL